RGERTVGPGGAGDAMKPIALRVVVAIAVGLGLFLWVYQPWDLPSERAEEIVYGLRESPVYADPGAPDIVDVERARQVIGDRAIVAAVSDTRPLPESDHANGPDYALCEDIAELTPTN